MRVGQVAISIVVCVVALALANVATVGATTTSVRLSLGPYTCEAQALSGLVDTGGFKLNAHHRYVGIVPKGRGRWHVNGRNVIFTRGPLANYNGLAFFNRTLSRWSTIQLKPKSGKKSGTVFFQTCRLN
jgi:hypothetical protein